MIVDGKTFWNRVDNELNESNRTLMALAKEMKIVYGTITDSRQRGALPKAEIIMKISRFLGISIDKLLSPKDVALSPKMQRIDRIRRACLVATEEDLALVERILRIGENARIPFDFSPNPYTLKSK